MTSQKIIRGAASSDNFNIVSQSVIRDSSISYRARGLLIRLLSNAPGFSMSAHDLADQGTEGRGAILAALRELREAGYLETTRVRNSKGRLCTINTIYDIPQKRAHEPESKNRTPVNRTPVDRIPVSRTSLEVPTESSIEKQQPPQSPGGPAGGGVDELHENLNPLPPDLQKKAIHQLAHLPTSLQKDIIDELAGQIREGVAKQPQGLLRVLVSSAEAGTLKTDYATRERARRAAAAATESRPAESRRQAEREFSVEDITPEFLASLPPGIRKKHEAALARKTGSTTPPADAG